MESKLITNFAHHQTAKAVWDSLRVTYGSGSDPFQLYDLDIKANKVSQGSQSLEDYWSELQAIWINIDQRDLNPIGCCEEGINKYKQIIGNRRLYQFLFGLDHKYDHIRRDILKEHPKPSAEVAFSRVRREVARLQILQPATNPDFGEASQGGIGTGLGVRH